MSPLSNNQAAWQTAFKTKPLQVMPGLTPDPAENEVVIKVAYAAVNPIDITGTDVAGTIVQLGTKVTRFKLGQRVIGHCDGLVSGKIPNSGFQLYSTCLEILVAEVPDTLPLVKAAVLPISISTAAAALYIDLKLPFPSLNPRPTSKKILIWGGSSSCGSSAIQLAAASGYTVVTTAGSANSEYVRDLGASLVFDHANPKVIDEIVEVLRPGDLVVDFIGTKETQTACSEILGRIGGGKLPTTRHPQIAFPENVEAVFILCLDVGLVNLDVGNAVWRRYVPEALAVGAFQAKPDSLLIKGGLEKVQDGIDLLRDGVSASKIVIEICKEL